MFVSNRSVGLKLVLPLLLVVSGCKRDVAVAPDENAGMTEEAQEAELSLGYDEPLVEEKTPGSEAMAAAPQVSLEENADIEELFRALGELERGAAFTEAWQMARDYRAENASNPRIGEVDERINRLNRLRRDAPELLYALNQMTDPNPTVRDVVQRQIVRGGETARILLRKAVRVDEPQHAAAAAEMLQQMGDEEGFNDVFNRLRAEEEQQARKVLLGVASQMLETQDAEGLKLVAASLQKTSAPDYIPLAAAVYQRLEDTDEKGTAPVKQAVNAYLLRVIKGDPGRDVLSAASAAAALSGDEALMSEFLQPGLRYYYYEMDRKQVSSVHDNDSFGELEPVKSGATNEITLAMCKRNDNIGLVFAGLIDIKEEGEYTFFTESDDGSFLFIGEEKLVDNGGMHGMELRSGQVTLTKGLHPFRVTWMQGGGGLGLEVYWQGPGFEREKISGERFFHQLSE